METHPDISCTIVQTFPRMDLRKKINLSKSLPKSLLTFGEPRMDPENSGIEGKVVGVKPFNVGEVDASVVKAVVLFVNNPEKNCTEFVTQKMH